MKLSRLLLLTTALVLLSNPLNAADRPEVEITTNLQQLGELARERKLPILLLFSSWGCPYCMRVKDEFLVPLLINRRYRERVIIREFLTDEIEDIRDFDGSLTTANAVTQHYGVFVSPTLLYLDNQGKEVAERQTGLTTPEFYSAYIDESIHQSLVQITERTEQQNSLQLSPRTLETLVPESR
ncbi:MAG: thioredoxin fold domain-containing protein [Gammaproteobacteria bacterium]|nr:thioredoxin fold domain-containing protein [Gammaproteobacteria bacterium]